MTNTPYSIAEIDRLLDQQMLDARQLHAIWFARQPTAPPASDKSHSSAKGAHEPVSWIQGTVELARRFVGKAIDGGEFLLAGDAAREALRVHPGDVELRLSLARALVRLGSSDDARRILGDLESTPGLPDGLLCQGLCLTGDIALDEAQSETFEEGRASRLRVALDAYRRASHSSPPVVAAKLQCAVAALLLGGAYAADAQQLAQEALALIQQTEAEDEPCLSLDLARAKALAISGRLDEARESYRAAAARSNAAAHELGAARKEARRLAHARDQRESFFDDCFPPLQLIVFSGHMLDSPGRTVPRFPAEAEAQVRGLLHEAVVKLGARVAISGAAAGADLIFLKEMLDRGRAVHVVLPWSKEEFLRTNVAPYGQAWVTLFHEVLGLANSVLVLGELFAPSDSVGLAYANAVMSGMARLKARTLNLDLVPLALWDGAPGAAGGTASFVNLWRAQAAPLEIIDLAKPGSLSARTSQTVAPHPAAPRSELEPTQRHPVGAADVPARSTLRQTVKTMLFADIVGYSKLPEAQIPVFVSEFMGRVSRLVSESKYSPVSVNTWGDAIYFVFDTPRSAGLFALDLVDMIANTAWEAVGVFWEDLVDGRTVRRPLSIRTGLHSGPVFVHFDPIVRRLGFTGAHVSRAARIEPVTEPGKIFASEAFAALAALDKIDELACNFVGTLPLAKKYPGEFRIYRLRRVKSLPLDALARVIHEEYCREATLKRGETSATNPSLRSWEELPADLQASNRAQAADIPVKLQLVGYEIEPTQGDFETTLALSPEDVERMAIHEHERWCERQRRNGWVQGPGMKDVERKTHPCLVAWEELPEVERGKDFAAVRNIPRLLALAGFLARRVAGPR